MRCAVRLPRPRRTRHPPAARRSSRAPRPSAAQAVHTLYVLYSGATPRLLAVVDLLVMSSMLLLFGNYRYHKYLKPFERVLAERRASGADVQPPTPAALAHGAGPAAAGCAADGQPLPPLPRHVASMGSSALDAPGIGPKLVLSFDSSGWLYLYHFGVCRFMQLHVLNEMPAERFAFSGSSGGALAATALACDVPIDDLVDEILAVCWPWCRKSPFAMCPAVDYALNKFLPDKGGRRSRPPALPALPSSSPPSACLRRFCPPCLLGSGSTEPHCAARGCAVPSVPLGEPCAAECRCGRAGFALPQPGTGARTAPVAALRTHRSLLACCSVSAAHPPLPPRSRLCPRAAQRGGMRGRAARAGCGCS